MGRPRALNGTTGAASLRRRRELKKCVKDIEELSHNLLLMQMCM